MMPERALAVPRSTSFSAQEERGSPSDDETVLIDQGRAPSSSQPNLTFGFGERPTSLVSLLRDAILAPPRPRSQGESEHHAVIAPRMVTGEASHAQSVTSMLECIDQALVICGETDF